MIDLASWFAAAAAGMALGALFFGGLWWTVKAAICSPRPGLLALVSLLVRLGITLAGFYLVADGHWQALIACLLGFVVARLIVTQLIAPRLACHAVRQPAAAPEITHAP